MKTNPSQTNPLNIDTAAYRPNHHNGNPSSSSSSSATGLAATPHQYQPNAQAARFPGTTTPTDSGASASASASHHRHPSRGGRDGGSLTFQPSNLASQDPAPQPHLVADPASVASTVHDFGSLSPAPKIFPGVLENRERERRRRSSVARSDGEGMSRSLELRGEGVESEGDE
jgi:hypothetical protein